MKKYIIHQNSIRKILKDNKFNISSSYSNGRIKGMISSGGDISLKDWNDGKDNIYCSIQSKKGNLQKALDIIKKNGYKINIWSHPSGISQDIIIMK